MEIKVKELATVRMGYSFRSRLESVANGDVAVIQMKDLLDDNTVGCDALEKVDMETVKDHHLVLKGDIVFRSRGQAINAAILLDDPGRAVVAAPLLRIRVTKPQSLLPEYLNWYINQRDAQAYLASRTKGTVQKMIGIQAIEDMKIALPSLDKQKTIVELVSLSARERFLLHTLAEKQAGYVSRILMRYARKEEE
ncbi:MAG: restriction endonuclease subunit S [Synergistota bacterium]|nr:restriction endonuclease subunit S [Synergistota bacterium]